MTFYAFNGAAVAYSNDGEVIYLYSGGPVAYLRGSSVYAYSGRHLGFFQYRWVRDHGGLCVFFTEDAQGGPAKPGRKVRPVNGARRVRPVRGVRQIRPIKAVRRLAWSLLSGRQFFARS